MTASPAPESPTHWLSHADEEWSEGMTSSPDGAATCLLSACRLISVEQCGGVRVRRRNRESQDFGSPHRRPSLGVNAKLRVRLWLEKRSVGPMLLKAL
ncbi:unnamed protein product [Boreogadus saida]